MCHEYIRQAIQLHVLKTKGLYIFPVNSDLGSLSIDRLLTLLCQSERLFDSECISLLPEELRTALHATVMDVCARLDLKAMLTCYCLTHNLVPPADGHAWVSVLSSLLQAADRGSSFSNSDLENFFQKAFSGVSISSLSDHPSLLLGYVAYSRISPLSLVNAESTLTTDDLRACFFGNPVLLYLFHLLELTSSSAYPHVLSLVQNNVVYDLKNLFPPLNMAQLEVEQTGTATIGVDDIDRAIDMTSFWKNMARLYAIEDVLDYRYYLQQARPLAAWAAVRSAGAGAWDANAVISVAVENFLDTKVLAASLIFLRCAQGPSDPNYTSLRLRDYVHIARSIFSHEVSQFSVTFNK